MSQIASFSSELVPKLMCATLSRIGGTVQYFHELLWLLSQRPQGTLANTQRVFLKDVCVFFLSIQGNFHQALYCFYNQANFLSLCWKVFYVKIVGDWFVSSSFFLLSRTTEERDRRGKEESLRAKSHNDVQIYHHAFPTATAKKGDPSVPKKLSCSS